VSLPVNLFPEIFENILVKFLPLLSGHGFSKWSSSLRVEWAHENGNGSVLQLRGHRWHCAPCNACRSSRQGDQGVDVMITIFCDFSQFSAEKLAFFLKCQCYDHFFQNLASFWVKNANFLLNFKKSNIGPRLGGFSPFFNFWHFLRIAKLPWFLALSFHALNLTNYGLDYI
jgi:hypothetical protein